jgi:hypothetical protein
MTVLIQPRGEFPSKSFKSEATKAWIEFFKVIAGDTDLAHWLIEADSATIRLTGRNSSVNENGPDWESPTPVVVLVFKQAYANRCCG